MRQVLSSNLSTELDDWGFSWFSLVPPGTFQDCACPLSVNLSPLDVAAVPPRADSDVTSDVHNTDYCPWGLMS
jgi:hypothetical protein